MIYPTRGIEPQSPQRAQRFEIIGKLDGWMVGRLKKSKPTTPQSNELTQKTTNYTNSTNLFYENLKPKTQLLTRRFKEKLGSFVNKLQKSI